MTEPRLARYQRKLREKGLRQIIMGRLRWYKLQFQMNNWFVGKLVELFGNRVKAHGVTISVDNPLVTPRDKSTLFFGIYEVPEFELSRRYLDFSLPTIELGASIGGIACAINKLQENPEAHVVVECNPVLLPTLEKNRDLNQCRFTIVPAAVAYGANTVSFTVVKHFMTGRLQEAEGERVTVRTMTLGRLIDEHGFETINLISDCEGAEVEMVEKDGEVFRRRVKHLILETHEEHLGDEPIARMLSALKDLGFEILERQRSNVLALVNRGLCMHRQCDPGRKRSL